jgi:hypothetical protein
MRFSDCWIVRRGDLFIFDSRCLLLMSSAKLARSSPSCKSAAAGCPDRSELQ